MSQRRLRAGIRPGRRPMTCYREAGHCLARWWFGHSFDRVLVLTTEEIARGVQPVNRRGVPVANVEGFMDGYDLVSPCMTPAMLDGMGGDPGLVAQIRHDTQVSVEMNLIESYIGVAAEARYRKCSFVWAMLSGGDSDLGQARQTFSVWYPEPDTRGAVDIQATQRAVALVRSKAGWRAITSLATALMERGELQWAEAEPLLAAAYGHERPNSNAWMAAWPPSLDMIRAGRFPEQQNAQ